MKNLKIFILVLFLLCTNALFAQAPTDPMPPTGIVNPHPEPAGAPIDSGVVGLLAAGLTYGFYKFKNNNVKPF